MKSYKIPNLGNFYDNVTLRDISFVKRLRLSQVDQNFV